ncbi:TPA: hypothetical protein QH057_000642 [Proteus mirabilis]|nr:hypothetical protein [Proteus mirabilis]HEJ9686668.1 hypothetical protein [Proteus mirabilis]
MIEQFDNQILDIFGIEQDSFDVDFLQWNYTFSKEGIKLFFVYSMDKTVSETLSIKDNKIYGDFDSNCGKRTLELDPINITFKWIDKLS